MNPDYSRSQQRPNGNMSNNHQTATLSERGNSAYARRNDEAQRQGSGGRSYDPAYQPSSARPTKQQGQQAQQRELPNDRRTATARAGQEDHRMLQQQHGRQAMQAPQDEHDDLPSFYENSRGQQAQQQRPQSNVSSIRQQEAQPPVQQPRDPNAQAVQRDNIHVYGGKAALTFERELRRQGTATIAIDAAPKSEDGAVNWNKKIRFQVSRSELPLVAGVFLGVIPEIRFDYHGDERNKSLHLINRAPNYIVRVMAGDTGMAVPLGPSDAYYVGCLCLDALIESRPGLPIEGHLAMIRMAANAHNAGVAAAASKGQQPQSEQARPVQQGAQRQYGRG